MSAHGPDPAAGARAAGGRATSAIPHHAATLVGHAHTQCATTFAGRPLLVGGGVASTVPLDAEPFPRVWEAGPPDHRVAPPPRRRPADHALAGALVLLAFDTATPLVTVALHDGADVVVELTADAPDEARRAARPAHRRRPRARRDRPPGPHRDRRGRRAGAVHRPAGRSGHRPHPRLRARDPGLRRVHARRARGRGGGDGHGRRRLRGGHGRPPQGGLLRDVRPRRQPAGRSRRRQAGRAGDRAARGRRGCRPLPRRLPERHGPDPTERRLAGARDRRGAGRAARPRAALPPPPGRRAPEHSEAACRDHRAAGHPRRPRRRRGAGGRQPRRRRLVGEPARPRASPGACRRSTTWSPRRTARSSATPSPASPATSPSCSGSR